MVKIARILIGHDVYADISMEDSFGRRIEDVCLFFDVKGVKCEVLISNGADFRTDLSLDFFAWRIT